jgi:GTP-binding protein
VLPTIAIVGRPNVGKSTLFNRIVGRRRAIVGDEPGITRDRLYGEAEWSGRHFRIVDTGGIIPDDVALIPSEIYRQARVALEEADATIFVVDVRTELASPDMDLARLLLRGGKPLFLAVNKVDTPQLEAEAENFRRLGMKNMYPVSAEHSTGVAELLDAVLAVLPVSEAEAKAEEKVPGESRRSTRRTRDKARAAKHATTPDVHELDVPALDVPEDAAEIEEGESFEMPARRFKAKLIAQPEEAVAPAEPAQEQEETPRETRIAIIGRPNVGKSTLLNALTGSDRAIVSPIAGTTRDAVDEMVERDGSTYRFVDTAGIRRKGKTHLMAEKLSVVMARKHLEESDVALLVIDALEGVTALDATIGGYAHESGRSVIIVINKWDTVGLGRKDGKPPADKDLYEEQVRHSLKYLDYAPVVFISASLGKNIDSLFSMIGVVARERRKRVTTGEMNRFIEKVDFERASVPMSKRVRIFYMTQAQVAPPTFIIFTDRDVQLHFAYERFLINQIRKVFGFIGTPIWIKNRARGK